MAQTMEDRTPRAASGPHLGSGQADPRRAAEWSRSDILDGSQRAPAWSNSSCHLITANGDLQSRGARSASIIFLHSEDLVDLAWVKAQRRARKREAFNSATAGISSCAIRDRILEALSARPQLKPVRDTTYHGSVGMPRAEAATPCGQIVIEGLVPCGYYAACCWQNGLSATCLLERGKPVLKGSADAAPSDHRQGKRRSNPNSNVHSRGWSGNFLGMESSKQQVPAIPAPWRRCGGLVACGAPNISLQSPHIGNLSSWHRGAGLASDRSLVAKSLSVQVEH